MKKEVKNLGMAIEFGAYKVTLARNGQVSYYKDGLLSKVVDKPIDFNANDLYNHVVTLAKNLGFKVEDLKASK